MLLLTLILLGCTPQPGVKCASGVRQTYQADVATPLGALPVTTSQCVTAAWTEAACDAGPELCTWIFEPHTEPEVPLDLIYGDFVFRHAVGHLELSPPEPDLGTDLRTGLEALQTERIAAGYYASDLRNYTLLGGRPAIELSVSCDHPDLDPICPYTWTWLFVDLGDVEPGLYADFSARTAEFLDMGDLAAPRPEEFALWTEMVAGAELAE